MRPSRPLIWTSLSLTLLVGGVGSLAESETLHQVDDMAADVTFDVDRTAAHAILGTLLPLQPPSSDPCGPVQAYFGTAERGVAYAWQRTANVLIPGGVLAPALYIEQSRLACPGGSEALVLDALERVSGQTGVVLDRALTRLRPLTNHTPFSALRGELPRPVDGDLSFGFGPEATGAETSVRHTGVTFVVDRDTEVRLVARGIIRRVVQLNTSGLALIVDHGDEFHTVYVGLDTVVGVPGALVEADSVLGTAGNSSDRLRFEVRYQATPLDPAAWLR